MFSRLAFIFLFFAAFAPCAAQSALRTPQSSIPLVRVAVLDFGEAEAGRRAADYVAKLLSAARGEAALKVAVLDRGLSRAAARGVGYRGSLNLTLREARDLGGAAGCDFFVTGDAQVLRRNPSERPAYFEAYASIFVVSTRTGRLILWERPAADAPTPERAEADLLGGLDERAAARYRAAIAEALAREEKERLEVAARGPEAEVVDLATDGAEAGEGVREPAPFRRLRPAYPDTAARAEAEATVDAEVLIGADGRVRNVEIVRWAGFGLDDAVVAAVRRMNFRPATRDEEPVASRVLLRYNFRRPPPEKK